MPVQENEWPRANGYGFPQAVAQVNNEPAPRWVEVQQPPEEFFQLPDSVPDDLAEWRDSYGQAHRCSHDEQPVDNVSRPAQVGCGFRQGFQEKDGTQDDPGYWCSEASVLQKLFGTDLVLQG